MYGDGGYWGMGDSVRGEQFLQLEHHRVAITKGLTDYFCLCNFVDGRHVWLPNNTNSEDFEYHPFLQD